jgi:prepilin-type N-terminal cleavage/methylation domain-containing protein
MHTLTPQLPAVARGRRAFTLTELLIVIGLIVLLIALAVPAFRAMTGGRSIDAAQNQLAAVLGAARAEAIGLQKVRGVLFYLDPATDRVNAAIVREVGYTPLTPVPVPPGQPDYFLDLVPDRDPVALPVGIGLQAVDSAVLTNGARTDDGYIGYNPLNVTPAPEANSAVPCGGVILFDGYGRVVSKFYGLLLGERPNPNSRQLVTTRLGELMGYPPGTNNNMPAHYIPVQTAPNSVTNNLPAQSMLGFVLYDAETFRSLGYTNSDTQFDYSPTRPNWTDERAEEDWLDKNAAPVLINRYNGSLIRGE